MKNSDWRNWLIPLLAAFAIYIPISSIPPSPDQQPSTQPQSPALVQMVPLPTPMPTPEQAPGRVSGEAAKLVCDFFGAKPVSDKGAQVWKKGQKQAPPTVPQDFDPKKLRGDYCKVKTIPELNGGGKSKLDNYEIEYLIATVPDPRESRLDHQFDRYLDAINRAIEKAGYNFDHCWLPWDRSRTAMPVASPTDPKAPQVAMTPRHLQEPGVILFRSRREDVNKSGPGDSGNKLLLLFLVGETPTGGINKVAFKYALYQIRGIDDRKRLGATAEKAEKAKKTLRIIGPSFSGSADSLAIALSSWRQEYKEPLEIKVCSGTATLIDKDYFLNKIGKENSSYHATVAWFEKVSDEFYEYLKRLDSDIKPANNDAVAPTRIAFLSEAASGAGHEVRKRINSVGQIMEPPSGKAEPTINVRMEINSAGRNEDQSSSSKRRPPILSFIFPLHISQLRIEAARQRRSRDEAAYALTLKDPNLALPMGEVGGAGSRDIVPLFSSLETVTMELALSEELDAIRRERIRYVGMTATDPQDRSFLVSEIRKHCPNAALFVFANDLLYLHSESNPDFWGALVVSSYPLFGLNQLWTYPFRGGRNREQFSNHQSQGIYNATLALLGEYDGMLEYGYPFEKYEKGGQRYPALWLSMVGRNGIWPVKAFKIDNPNKEQTYTFPVEVPPSDAGASNAGGEAKPTPSFGVYGHYRFPTGLLILLLIGVICLSLSLFRPGRLAQIFGDEEFYRYRLDRRINMVSCRVSLAVITLFISSVAMLPEWFMQEEMTKEEVFSYPSLMYRALSAVFVFALVVIIWCVVRLIWWMISGRRHFHGFMWYLLALGGAAMITFFGCGLIKIFRFKPTEEQLFFFLRTTGLASGVSILLPGLLIGLAAVLSFFASLWRLNLTERMACLRKPRQQPDEAPQFLDFDHPGAGSFEGLKPLENNVKEMIVRPIHDDRMWWLIVIVSFLLYSFYFLRHFIPSVEGPAFDWFFILGFYLVPLALFLALVRFFRLWREIEKLLRWLSVHPLIKSFAARQSVKKRCSSLPPVDLMTSTQTLVAALTDSTRQAQSFSESLEPLFSKSSRLQPEKAETVKRIKDLAKEVDKLNSDALKYDAKGEWKEALISRRCLQNKLAELSHESAELLKDSWRKDGAEGTDDRWRYEGKFFLITHIVVFLHHVFAHFRYLVALVTIGLLLMLITVISYPFQPREALQWFSWVGILTSVTVMIYIFVKISRDKTLSLLAGTKPGGLNVTSDFVTRVMIHGVVPVVAMLGVQFPDAVRRILSWLSGVFDGKGT